MKFAAYAGALVFLAALEASSLVGQTSTPSLQQVLSGAASSSSMEAEGALPFHLEADFSTTDYLGKDNQSGTLTVDFLKTGMRKVIVRSNHAAPNGSKAQAHGAFLRRLLVERVLWPGPLPSDLQDSDIKEKSQKVAGVALRCFTVTPSKSIGMFMAELAEMYCLSQNTNVIRISQRLGFETLYNDIVSFGGHTVARQLQLQEGGRVRAKLTITSLTAAPKLAESDFSGALQDSSLPQEELSFRAAAVTSRDHVLSKVMPHYPDDAKLEHVSGTVLQNVTLSETGTVEDIEVISAPSRSLAEAAGAAVTQWKFKPIVVDGKPVRAQILVTTHFSFG